MKYTYSSINKIAQICFTYVDTCSEMNIRELKNHDEVHDDDVCWLSPKMRFMFDIKKLLLLIDMLTFIPRVTQDDLLRVMIDLPEFCRIPKEGHITDYSKAERTVRPATLRYSTTQFVTVSLCCISLWHDDMKLIYCGILFLRGFYITAS